MISNLSASIRGSYAYVTDPPVLADVGEVKLDVDSLGVVLDGHNYYENDVL